MQVILHMTHSSLCFFSLGTFCAHDAVVVSVEQHRGCVIGSDRRYAQYDVVQVVVCIGDHGAPQTPYLLRLILPLDPPARAGTMHAW